MPPNPPPAKTACSIVVLLKLFYEPCIHGSRRRLHLLGRREARREGQKDQLGQGHSVPKGQHDQQTWQTVDLSTYKGNTRSTKQLTIRDILWI